MTEKTLKVFELTGAALTPVGQKFQAEYAKMIEDYPDLTPPDSMHIQYAAALSPQSLGLAHIYKRAPYTNPEQVKQNLRESAERGWLHDAGDGAYRITDKGQAFYDRLIAVFVDIWGNVDALSEAELDQLNGLLLILINTALATNQVIDKHALELGRKFVRPEWSATLQARRNMVDVRGFRDDAHVAAWSQLEISGHTLEALTFIWNDEAHTAAELVEKLAYRNYDEAAYAASLKDLTERGWVEQQGDTYAITAEGKRVREDVERLTNDNFESAFADLSDAQIDQLISLLEAFVAAVTPVAEEQ